MKDARILPSVYRLSHATLVKKNREKESLLLLI